MNPVSTVTPIRSQTITIGGLTPLTTIDYPGELAMVVYLQGCPWRCGYCQNGELLPGKPVLEHRWDDILERLSQRKGLLDGVVFSGGEPTMQTGLAEAMQQVKSLGFKVGLHTAGIYPQRLEQLLPLIDWVGMDMKAPFDDYDRITGVKGSGERARACAELIINAAAAYEFRTTVHPQMLDPQQLDDIVRDLKQLGAEHYCIQDCETRNCLQEQWQQPVRAWTTPDVIEPIAAQFKSFTHRSH